jgi:hypothetical protein
LFTALRLRFCFVLSLARQSNLAIDRAPISLRLRLPDHMCVSASLSARKRNRVAADYCIFAWFSKNPALAGQINSLPRNLAGRREARRFPHRE